MNSTASETRKGLRSCASSGSECVSVVMEKSAHQFLPEFHPFGLPFFNLSQGRWFERGSSLPPIEN